MTATSPPLWTLDDLLAATGGRADGPQQSDAAIAGVSIDTRTIGPDELFVALKDIRDGHEFVTAAFNNGAAAALVANEYERREGDGLLVRVDDPLKALEQLAAAARARLAAGARVVAVTGSAGKTTTKEMLRACFMRVGRVHASEKSYNNHWGVPLTLARMPRETDYAVIEIGMNHAGEITPLSRLARPHVAVITTVVAVHLEHFASVEEIADAKAEIFAGLEAGGTAILPADNPYFERLAAAAAAKGGRIVSFGRAANSDLGLDADASAPKRSVTAPQVTAIAKAGDRLSFGLGLVGDHMMMNALAVVLTLQAAGASLEQALPALGELRAGAGRGERTVLRAPAGDVLLIDESYNANPASMKAAIGTARGFIVGDFKRLVPVLGDMLELGPDASQWHAELAASIDGDDMVFAAGPHMRHLFDALKPMQRGAWGETSGDIEAALLAQVQPGDVVMVKGSNASRMGRLVDALKKQLSPVPPEGASGHRA